MRGGLAAIRLRNLFLRRSRCAEEAPSFLQKVSVFLLGTPAVAHMSLVSRKHSKFARLLLPNDVHSVNLKCCLPTCCSLRLKPRFAIVVRLLTSAQPALDATLEEPSHGGYAGVRVVEAQHQGPTAHESDCARERLRTPSTHQRGRRRCTRQPELHHARVQNLQLSDTSATQTTRTSPVPPPVPNSLRPTQPQARQQRDYRRCAQCGAGPEVRAGSTDHGLTMHTGQKRGGQQLSQGSVAQVRQLGRAACVFCGTIRSRRSNRCSLCKKNTATRDITDGDVFQDRRQPGHHDAAASVPNPHQPPHSSQPVPPGEQSTSELLHSGRLLLQNQTGNSSPTSAEPQQWPFRVCSVSRNATACAESLEGAISGHQSCASVDAACCLQRNIRCSFGKQATFTSSLEEYRGSNNRDRFAGEKRSSGSKN